MKDHQLTVILEPSREEIQPILDGLTEFGIQAIGGRILECMISQAIEQGCSEIRLDSMNPRSKSFYEKHGFKIYAEIADYLPGFTRTFYTKLA